MYDRLYKQEPEKTDRKKQSRKENKTGIPNSMKTRFEEMSGYSFDDVRVHYSSSRPARFNALAYTQGNQVHIAPGQEKYLEHELGHVVQQKEGRVKPTFRIGNVPVNDDKALEQEADVRLHRDQSFASTDRDTYRGQDVLQGQFIKGRIDPKPYYQQLIVILDHFRTAGDKDSGCNNLNKYSSSWEENIRNKFDEIYGEIEKIYEAMIQKFSTTSAEWKKEFSRIDILKNMIDHCDNEEYEHYHMYQDDKTQENLPNGTAHSLVSAIDCRQTEINVNDVHLKNVLWIESFVSFQPGAGTKLMDDIINNAPKNNIEYVALGAYRGTEKYYRDTLGMQKLDLYVLENDNKIVNSEIAIQNLKDSKIPLGLSKDAKPEDYISRGIDLLQFYPVYYINLKNNHK